MFAGQAGWNYVELCHFATNLQSYFILFHVSLGPRSPNWSTRDEFGVMLRLFNAPMHKLFDTS